MSEEAKFPDNEEATILAVCAGIERHRYWACSMLGQDGEELLAVASLAAIVAIRHGVTISHPDAYAHGILRNMLGHMISARCSERRHCGLDQIPQLASQALNPEQILLEKEAHPTLVSILDGSRKPADREILTRFYVSRESKELICEEMHLTPTQFRINKSRAKSRLTQRISTPDRRAA